jgi:hypothetical protein
MVHTKHVSAVVLLALLTSSSVLQFAAAQGNRNKQQERKDALDAPKKQRGKPLDSPGGPGVQKRTRLTECVNRAASNTGECAVWLAVPHLRVSEKADPPTVMAPRSCSCSSNIILSMLALYSSARKRAWSIRLSRWRTPDALRAYVLAVTAR